MSGKAYAVATVKPWNVTAYHRHAPSLPGRWQLIDKPEDLSAERLLAMRPRHLLFARWSWQVPTEILEQTKRVRGSRVGIEAAEALAVIRQEAPIGAKP
jgi:hypothetical protein